MWIPTKDSTGDSCAKLPCWDIFGFYKADPAAMVLGFANFPVMFLKHLKQTHNPSPLKPIDPAKYAQTNP